MTRNKKKEKRRNVKSRPQIVSS
uniref:Uncharacterized protein n=1 Tax=Anopheles albimanus TaxID=7167 RepID=A0A182FZ78_ANOAL